MEIAYNAVELDVGEHADSGLADTLRSALLAETGASTVPQIFIGGEAIGGFTETYEAYKSGSLQDLLDKHAVPFNRNTDF